MNLNFLKDNYRIFLLITFLLLFVLVSYKWIDNKKISKTLETYNVSSGNVDIALVYKDHTVDYIPQDNEVFVVNVVAKPNGVNFIGGTLVISYNKNELEFVNGRVLAELSEMEEITVGNLDSQTNTIRTSIGFLSSKTINTQTPILELKFKKIGTQESKIEVVANRTEIAIEEESTNKLGGITNLVLKKKQGNQPSSGNVDLSLLYFGQNSSYIPKQNEEFDVNVLVSPRNNSKFIGGTLAISYNRHELEFISGNVLAELSELEEISLDSEKTKITTSVGFLSNKTINTQTPILKLRFKRINKNLTSLNFLNGTQIVTEESSDNQLGSTSGLEIRSISSTPLPTVVPSSVPTIIPTSIPTFTGEVIYKLVPETDSSVIGEVGTKISLNVILKDINDNFIQDQSDIEYRWESSNPQILWLSPSGSKTFVNLLKQGKELVIVNAVKKSENRILATMIFEVKALHSEVLDNSIKLRTKISGLENREGLVVKALVGIKDGSTGSKLYVGMLNFTYDANNYFVSEDIDIDLSVNNIDIKIKGEKHLARTYEKISTSSREITLFGELEPGDLSLPETANIQDGIINDLDRNYIVQNWASTDSNILNIADVNYDGKINGFDSALLIKTLSTKYDEK